jgi:hypothetical protein
MEPKFFSPKIYSILPVPLENLSRYFALNLNCVSCVRNRTLTLIEREDDTRSWGNFLIYFSHFTTMPCPPRG